LRLLIGASGRVSPLLPVGVSLPIKWASLLQSPRNARVRLLIGAWGDFSTHRGFAVMRLNFIIHWLLHAWIAFQSGLDIDAEPAHRMTRGTILGRLPSVVIFKEKQIVCRDLRHHFVAARRWQLRVLQKNHCAVESPGPADCCAESVRVKPLTAGTPSRMDGLQ
jgi:hypothetical protein